jgi:hypothetical protein
VIDIDPPTPDLDVPDPNDNEPLLPVLADPVLNTKFPLAPAVPASPDFIVKSPLDHADEAPLEIET